MSIIRKRSAAHKSYLPNSARDNQYILAEFTISDELIKRFSVKASTKKITPSTTNNSSENYCEFYQNLAKVLFDLSELFEVENCLFIANDKLTRVRFNQEMHQWQTNQQILFYYNPESHQLKKSFYDANKRAKKISLLFLTTGTNIRENAAGFHAKISQLVTAFSNKTAIELSDIRLRDHQHITYDLFNENKLNKNKPTNNKHSRTQEHKLRSLINRYASQQVTLPEFHSSMTYAIINLPISNRLLNMVDVDPNSTDPYNPLYTYLTDTFTQSAKRYNLNNGALIANGLVPIVRYSIHEITSRMGELQMLGYNPAQNPCGIVSKWDASELVDNVQLVFVATDKNQTEHGFGRFLNQIEQAIKLMATELEMEPHKEEVIVRFHQHVAYNF
ncbi:DUF3083 family protein [Candidatus Colwellia aromaticivorans]|uniref:DUF3083 family protein n=1 Tax=Candidatus Colwellia aromaticivorans TaxID=2267621 RepID=UPI000DF29C67|nr:DUF3083 family protein [Candidatus Colwellia aromaticivorans]